MGKFFYRFAVAEKALLGLIDPGLLFCVDLLEIILEGIREKLQVGGLWGIFVLRVVHALFFMKRCFILNIFANRLPTERFVNRVASEKGGIILFLPARYQCVFLLFAMPCEYLVNALCKVHQGTEGERRIP